MCRKRIAYAHAKSVYEIDIEFYKKNNVKFLFLDLDNTLDSYKLYHPTEKAFELKKKLLDAGITPYIISNNKGKRVSSYANDLGVEYLNSAFKPFAKRINKFLEEKHIDKNEVMMVGDQMFTDVGAGNRAKIKVILTDKIVKEDQWTTKFNRIFDHFARKHALKKGELKDWRTL